jgi:hypothetical protein
MNLPDVTLLARIAADHDPAVGDWSPRAFYGPWAEVADRHALLTAMAHAAFVLPEGPDHRSPVQRWRASKPAPPAELRAAVRALERAPLETWIVHTVDAAGVTLSDPTGLRPETRVTLGRTARLDRAPRPGDALLLRIVEGTAWGPMALAKEPT